MLVYFWAYAAGVLTLVNPCVLPLLPIIIASALQGSRAGPAMLAVGLTVSFTVIGVLVTAFGHLVGLDLESMNRIAAVLMIVFGIALLVPRAQRVFERLSTPLASGAGNTLDGMHGTGAGAQFMVGALLGAVWSPCIGPTLGGAISLAARGEGLLHAGTVMLVFGIGVSSVLLALAYGSRELVQARRARLMALMPLAKPIMGVTLLLVGIALYFHLFRAAETWLLDVMPAWLLDLSVRF